MNQPARSRPSQACFVPETPAQRSIIVGMGGWDLPPFDDVFYPPKPGRDFRKLAWYARFFDFVELNASFYSTSLSPAQAKRWLRDVEQNPGFCFAVKLFRAFTHTLDATPQDVVSVRRLLEPLHDAGKLAGLIMQFPSGFGFNPERLAYLAKLADAFEGERVCIELRHRSWDRADADATLQERNVCLVNSDLPRLAHHMPLRAHASKELAYVRLMGRNAETWNHPERGDRYWYHYSEAELRDILQRIATIQPVPQRTFVVFHNDPNAHSPANGFQLRHLMKAEERPLAPAGLVKRFPELEGSTRVENKPEELF